jgi:hypothetical protein
MYDDTGAMLIQLNGYAQSHHLYKQIYSCYGPFHSEFFYILSGFGGLTWTHDRMGVFVLSVWIFCSLLAGAISVSLTGHAFWGILGQMISFLVLEPLKGELGHPISLCILLLTGVVICFQQSIQNRTSLAYFAAIGAGTGLLFATKINIGIFCAITLVVSLSALLKGRWTWLFYPACALLLLLPFVLVRATWSVEMCWEFSLALLAALIPCLCALAPSRRGFLGWAYPATLFFGFMIALTGSAVFIYLTGTSLSELLNAVAFRALKLGKAFMVEPPLDANSVLALVLLSTAGSSCILLYPRFSKNAKGLLLLVQAFVLLCLFGSILFISVYYNHQILFFCLAMFWALIWEPEPSNTRTAASSCIAFICLLAIIQTLSGYPVFGSQACVPAYLVSLLAPYALFKCVAILSKAFATDARTAFLARGAALFIVVTKVAFLLFISGNRFEMSIPLNQPGASLFRSNFLNQATFSSLSYNLRHFYSGFVAVPGFNSLYPWSKHLPPTGFNTTANYSVLTDQEQESIVKVARNELSYVILWSPALFDYWNQGKPISPKPLYRFVQNETRIYAGVMNFEFRTVPSPHPIPVDYCAMYIPEWNPSTPKPSILLCYPYPISSSDKFTLVSAVTNEEWPLTPSRPLLSPALPNGLKAGSQVFICPDPIGSPQGVDWGLYVISIKRVGERYAVYIPFFRPPAELPGTIDIFRDHFLRISSDL